MGHHGGVEAGRHIIPIHCMPHRFVNNEKRFSMIYLYLLAENVKQYSVFVCVRSAGMENSYHKIIVFWWHKRETVTERHKRESELFERFCSYFHRLELAILTIQKKEPMVSVVYDLVHLIWKTYHFSRKSKREFYGLGQELGVDICTPSSVKGTCLNSHVHRALKVFLQHGQEDLTTDQGQLFCSIWSTWL